ncbi:helix-turn-helix domain-containing protein [Gracilibacillus xinjiangensis]|uniref:Helix-turn-helix domain-containing protein n=1 Tax=Gracilibacillus xinjiangensis TaxID=1193282 RepID=A0ABV8WWB9_9BACI
MEEFTLSKRLKNLRERKGMLQKQVADKLGIKANTLSGYENGTRSPDPKLLNDLADFYNVTVDYLLGRTDNPEGKKKDDNINRAFHEFDNITDKEKEYLEEQLRLFRKLNEED